MNQKLQRANPKIKKEGLLLARKVLDGTTSVFFLFDDLGLGSGHKDGQDDGDWQHEKQGINGVLDLWVDDGDQGSAGRQQQNREFKNGNKCGQHLKNSWTVLSGN
uniref:Uncharacterized protein n=1 Tax=Panagrolaimus sp. JU765 TaxID=591449 RepID=A0AC34R381_9BILA